MPRTKPTPNPLTELINSQCLTWPACICGQKLGWHVSHTLTDEAILTPQEIERTRLDLALSLSCAARHCPDKRFRQHATIQLHHPVFAPMRKSLQ